MKRLMTMILWWCLSAQANEVVSTGYGRTVDEAMQNAKTTAVEQIAGTFIVSQATVDTNSYRSRIDQFNAGLIKRYVVVSTRDADGLVEVVIKADVDTDKVNTILTSSGAEMPTDIPDKLAKSRDDFEKTKKIVDALDDPAQAFVVQVDKITYSNRGDLTDVEVQAQIVYSPKWYDDVRVMAKTIGREVNIGSAWADALWGLSALSAIVNPALPGTISSLARRAEKPVQESHEYMACFGKDNGWDVDVCYEIRHPLRKATDSSSIRVGGRVWMGDQAVPLKELTVDSGNQLFEEVDVGKKNYFNKSAKERQFENPGILLFRKGTMPFKYAFTARTDELERITRVEFISL